MLIVPEKDAYEEDKRFSLAANVMRNGLRLVYVLSFPTVSFFGIKALG